MTKDEWLGGLPEPGPLSEGQRVALVRLVRDEHGIVYRVPVEPPPEGGAA